MAEWLRLPAAGLGGNSGRMPLPHGVGAAAFLWGMAAGNGLWHHSGMCPCVRRVFVAVVMSWVWLGTTLGGEVRPPRGEPDLKFWLENMAVHHGYSDAEMAATTGLPVQEVREALTRFHLDRATLPQPGNGLKVLPYPGGRHPRSGFLEGAVNPQRDTKLSVFTPWDPRGYVVVDVPEAVWSGLGLTYLAHTHLPTIWDRAGIRLEPVEWNRRVDGSWQMIRVLPGGIVIGVRAQPARDHVAFRWWVRNGTTNTLTGLHAQVCVMLGRAGGFEAQTAEGKRLEAPFAAARDASGKRWVVTAWDSIQRVWQNPPVPCIHSDPRLGDCPPGETRECRGWLWFYEGDNIDGELARLRREFLASPMPAPDRLEPVPDKLVVLTFDDSVASLHANVRPILREAGFGATFFITEGFSFPTNKADYMTWSQIAELHRDGFEVGNHTRNHMGVGADSLGRLHGEVTHIHERCVENGIPKPVSFAYPGNAIHPGGLPILRGLGIRFARRGAQPEFAYETGRGVAYDPALDHPLLIPTTGDARPTWSLKELQAAAGMARDGRIAVLQFHGVPDREHPWVNTPLERFKEYVGWLKANGYRCIAMRDLARYVNPDDAPAEAWGVIERRIAEKR